MLRIHTRSLTGVDSGKMEQQKEVTIEVNDAVESTVPRSKERRHGIVGPPPILNADGTVVKIGENGKSDRQRRNGIVDAPFVGPDGFVTSSAHRQTDDSRSR